MSKVEQFGDKPEYQTATVSAGGTESTEVRLHGCTGCVIEMPASITSTTMTFQGSVDGSTYATIKNSSDSAVTYSISNNGSYPLDPAVFIGYDSIKIIMGSTESSELSIKVKAVSI